MPKNQNKPLKEFIFFNYQFIVFFIKLSIKLTLRDIDLHFNQIYMDYK